MSHRWFAKRALLYHLAVALWVPGCLGAGWWQVNVALGGDHLAYVYSVEWPVFAIFGVVVWWNLLHDDPEQVGRRAQRRARLVALSADDGSGPDRPGGLSRRRDEEDGALAAYNDYLEHLAAADRVGAGRAGRVRR